MALRNCSNLLAIVVVLSTILFSYSFGSAFAQSKPVSLLIDNFEAKSPIPDELKYLKGAGATMLRTALNKSASMTEFVRFRFVERGDMLNKLLAEAGIHERLPQHFDKSTVKALKGIGADYVIFVDYFAQPANSIRVDARMVEVEEVAAEISEFHVFSANDPDPLQALADKLMCAYLEKVLGKKPVSPESFILGVLSFRYKGPEDYKDTKRTIPKILTGLLIMSKIKKLKYCSADEMAWTEGKNLSQLVAMNPEINFFIIGEILIFELDAETTARVIIRSVDRKGVTLVSTVISCEPTALIVGTDDILKKFVEDLKNDWPTIIKKKDRK